MKLRDIICGGLLALVVIGALVIPAPAYRYTPAAPTLSALVMISDRGHGSGVNLGNGVILTAAHVVEDSKTVDVTDSMGAKHPGTVLWVNTEFDVALVRTDAVLDSRQLSCRPLVTGEPVKLMGYPFNFGAVTTWGRIAASSPRQVQQWGLVSYVDATTGPGMSGGPVFDSLDHVIGIVVGGMPGFQVNLIVPAEAICPLLARETKGN